MVPAMLRYKNPPITTYAARSKTRACARRSKSSWATEMSALVLVMLLAFRTRNKPVCGRRLVGFWDGHRRPLRGLGGTLRL